MALGNLHFKYLNLVDAGSIFSFSSEQTLLPASNVQNALLAKRWRTGVGFVVHDGNVNVPFRDTSTGSVKNFAIAKATYTGAALAQKIASGLDSVGDFTDHTATYDTSTRKFVIGRTSTALGLFSLLWTSAAFADTTVAVLTGYDRTVDLTGANDYTSTAPTLGNEHEIVFTFTATQTVDSLIIDRHSFTSTVQLRYRITDATASVFDGGYNSTADIIKTATIPFNSSPISIEFTGTLAKAIQIYWFDRDRDFTEIGRVWVDLFWTPVFHQNVDISYSRATLDNRSRSDESEGGQIYFDRKDSRREFRIPFDDMESNFNQQTITDLRDMFDFSKNDRELYISLNPNLSTSTVYGVFVGDFNYRRLNKTRIFRVSELRFREQL